jgi:RTX calcium-binding nonapeptide repeat (4 copies)
MLRRTLLVAVMAAAAVAVPSAAQAATLERFDGISRTLLLTGAPSETNLVTVEGSHRLTISDLNMPLELRRTPGCMPLDPYSVECAGYKRIALDLNDGPDVATIATSREVWLSGGAGNDRYTALGTATDRPSRVDFDGGFGIDTASYFYATEGVHIGVDGMPFDGRPGDNDRIDREVEIVQGSEHADVLTGTQRSQQLFGGEGDDEISGGPAQDVLDGGRGDDRIDARDGELDTIDCGGRPFVDQLLADPVEASIAGCAS